MTALDLINHSGEAVLCSAMTTRPFGHCATMERSGEGVRYPLTIERRADHSATIGRSGEGVLCSMITMRPPGRSATINRRGEGVLCSPIIRRRWEGIQRWAAVWGACCVHRSSRGLVSGIQRSTAVGEGVLCSMIIDCYGDRSGCQSGLRGVSVRIDGI